MARHPRIESCMFCFQYPHAEDCEADDAKPKKKAAPRKAAPKKEVPAAPAPVEQPVDPISNRPVKETAPPPFDVKAAMKSAAAKSPQAAATPPPPKEQAPKPEPEVDEELMRVVNTLEPILHRNEIAKYRDILNMPASRAMRWRMRQGLDG